MSPCGWCSEWTQIIQLRPGFTGYLCRADARTAQQLHQMLPPPSLMRGDWHQPQQLIIWPAADDGGAIHARRRDRTGAVNVARRMSGRGASQRPNRGCASA
ncbi:MAG: hypothetical protein R3A44_44605 [Caldilineaceae bacterium]